MALLEVFNSLERIIYASYPFFVLIWKIIKVWWWLPIPFILWKIFVFLYIQWRINCFLKRQKFVLFEIRIPRDISKPIRAMENVINGLWQVLYDPPRNWWEKWIEGKILLSYSFEIALIEGNIHFFIRALERDRSSIESSIYSQYPQVEISIVDDYTKAVPPDIPNKNWKLWGTDYRLLNDSAYPIRTYRDFETEHESSEAKRIDPLSILFEASANIGIGEQIWIQILAEPITDDDFPWITKANELKDDLIGRKEEKRSIIDDIISIVFKGVPPGYEQTKEFQIESSHEKGVHQVATTGATNIQPAKKGGNEAKLTSGEQDIVSAIEQKIAKRGFKSSIRFIYLGEKDVFSKPKIRLPFSYFSFFGTEHLNRLLPYGEPFITSVSKSWFLPLNILRERRLYMRQRSIFRKYKERYNRYFPREEPENAKKKVVFVLNTEEIASLFHFPSKEAAPAPFIERIETKKSEEPLNLPME